MTPVESAQIRELSARLFGDDGQGGALGRMESMLNQQDGRISALERDRIAREAVAAAGERIDLERQQSRRWQITTFIALGGTTIALFAGVMNILIQAAAK
jgi:hypothetical protein